MSLEGVLDRLDIKRAVEIELSTRTRLMPPRWDRIALATQADEVARWLLPQYRKNRFGQSAQLVFVEKSRNGVRPISEFSVADRVLYRALVSLIAENLPAYLVVRPAIADFYTAPLALDGARYISKTDVTAYYEFVDHELLEIELLAQTGEAPAIRALIDLLGKVMGRRVGIPQVHKSSDILGDTYIDPVRRRMIRAGYDVFTYSDDFRIASKTLAGARGALEACATEVRGLGLVLNESKTFTYGVDKYRASLTAFDVAERKLFEGEAAGLSMLQEDGYADSEPEERAAGADTGGGEPPRLGAADEDDAVADNQDHEGPTTSISDQSLGDAAKRAWALWIEDYDTGDSQKHHEASITQSLFGKALPFLGSAGELQPLEHLSWILRREPALTPAIAKYLINLGATGQSARTSVRRALDELVAEPSFSMWQQMWLAEVAGGIVRSKNRPLYDWLRSCVESAHPPLAATASAAIGRLRIQEPELLARALDRVGPVWRDLVMWGLAALDADKAEEFADDKLDRILIAGASGMRRR